MNLSETDREISHYRLIELLGRGGMGEVWRAEDTQLTSNGITASRGVRGGSR